MSTTAPPIPARLRRAARWRPHVEVVALARIEGRRLLRHPAFIAGVLLSIAFVVFYLSNPDPRSLGMLVSGYAVLPLAAGTLIAANLGALRSRRDNTDELYASLPRRRAARTAGQLMALAWTLPVSALLVASAYIAASSGALDRYSGPFKGAAAVELAQGPLAVVALGAIGILLARVAPAAIVAVLLIIAGFFVEFELTFWLVGQQTVEGRSPAWVHWLAPLANDAIETVVPCPPGVTMPPGPHPPGCGIDLRHDVSGLAWHVSYLAAATMLVGAAALVRARRAMWSLIALIPLLAITSALAAG